MGKKKFNFGNEEVVDKKEKTVDELFEEQFKNRKPEESSSAMPPDIPLSLKDINKMTNTAAFEDEGIEMEEVLEHKVVEDGEGFYDEEIVEELEEELEEEAEEEIDAAEAKKKKRKADQEKGRKNELAYQKKTREMDEANRLHDEEMRKQTERLHQQDELNKAKAEAFIPGEEISATEKRNQSLMDDDFESEKQEQAKAQKEKTDSMIAEQRAKEEAAKSYEGFGNKNIDFSGKNEHGKQETPSYKEETEVQHSFKQEETTFDNKKENYKSDINSEATQTVDPKHDNNPYKTDYNHKEASVSKNNGHSEASYQSGSDFKENKNKETPVSPLNINESENQGSKTSMEQTFSHTDYESESRKQEKRYIDDDYEKAAQQKAEARKEQFKNMGTTENNQSGQKINNDNHSGSTQTTRVDYRSETKGQETEKNESKFGTTTHSEDRRPNYTEGQTRSSSYGEVNHQKNDAVGRTTMGSGQNQTTEFQKNNNYRNNYGENGQGNEKFVGNQVKSQNQFDAGSRKTYDSEKGFGIPPSSGSTDSVRENESRKPIKVSDYRSSNNAYKVGGGKDLDSAHNTIQDFGKNNSSNIKKAAQTFTVVGTGAALENSNEKSFISTPTRKTNYRNDTLKGSEPTNTFVKEEPTFRKDKSADTFRGQNETKIPRNNDVGVDNRQKNIKEGETSKIKTTSYNEDKKTKGFESGTSFDKKESPAHRTTDYRDKTLKGSEPTNTFVKEEPTFRKDKVVASGKDLKSGNDFEQKSDINKGQLKNAKEVGYSDKKENPTHRTTDYKEGTVKGSTSTSAFNKEETTFRKDKNTDSFNNQGGSKTTKNVGIINGQQNIKEGEGLKQNTSFDKKESPAHRTTDYRDKTLKGSTSTNTFVKEEPTFRKDKVVASGKDLKSGNNGVQKPSLNQKEINVKSSENTKNIGIIKGQQKTKEGENLKQNTSFDKKESPVHRTTDYRNKTLKGSEPTNAFVKEEPTFRKDKVVASGKDLKYGNNGVQKPSLNQKENSAKGSIQTPNHNIDNKKEVKVENNKASSYRKQTLKNSQPNKPHIKEESLSQERKAAAKNRGIIIAKGNMKKVQPNTENKTTSTKSKNTIKGNSINTAGKVGIASKKLLERNKHILENAKAGQSKVSSPRTADGTTFTTQLHLKNKKDNSKGIVINKSGEKISIASVKKQYAKTMGYGFKRAGKGLLRTFTREIWSEFKQNDAMRTADKTKTIVLGALATGSMLRTARHSVGNIFNIAKTKERQLKNAWAYFKGPQEKMQPFLLNLERPKNIQPVLLNLERGAKNPFILNLERPKKIQPFILNAEKTEVIPELKLVPHTLKQFNNELDKFKDLQKLTSKQLNSRIKALKAIKNPTLIESRELKRLQEFKALKKKKGKFLKDKKNMGNIKSVFRLLTQSILNSADDSAQMTSMMLDSTRYIRPGIKIMKTTGKLGVRAGNFTFRKVKRVGTAINKIPVVNNVTTKVVATRPVAFAKGKIVAAKELKGRVKQATIKQLNGGIYKSASKLKKSTITSLKKAPSKIKKGTKVVATTKKGVKATVKKAGSAIAKLGASAIKTLVTGLSSLIGGAIAALGSFLLPVIMILGIVLIFVVVLFSVIPTDVDNLQKYVDSLVVKSDEYFGEIEDYRSQGGKKHGKYKTVTVNFVDENGNQIDSTDNLKEILSMTAVKIENDWPDWYEFIDSGKVDDIAKQLFDDSHKIETTEIGPYSCSGCEERDYKCTDSLPSDASAGRIENYNLYAERGGCLEYKKISNYYCDSDKLKTYDGEVFNNAHSTDIGIASENTQIDNWYNAGKSTGGCKVKHETKNHTPYENCNNYTTEKFLISTIEDNYGWPSPITFTWNSEEGHYEKDWNGTLYSIDRSYTTDTITYVKENGSFKYYGTRYICKEYYCPGHELMITRYKCDGHTEIYCPGDHYDLVVNAIILHLPELYEADSSSLGVVESYPADAAEDDFYWDNSNREWCQTIYEQDWNSVYKGLNGLSSSVITGTTLTDEEIQAYLDNLPADLSSDRRKIIETALNAVGKIPYYWGGYATVPGLEGNHFGTVTTPDEDGRNLKGLDCSHFVDWVCWTALGNNLGNSWTGAIWDQSMSISSSSLKPGDLGFQNEGGNPVNHVGFYLGNGYWIHCSGGAGNVVVNNTSVFSHYRRLYFF